jgi:hypothetical protein
MSELWTDFWNFIWLFFWGFAMVAYLFAVFTVIGDLFRDRSLNGWWKALWIACIIFLPFLTVLVYVIARGSGLVERLDNRPPRGMHAAPEPRSSAASASDTFGAATARAAVPAPVVSPAVEIHTAKELLDRGAITPVEFEALKNRALAGAGASR